MKAIIKNFIKTNKTVYNLYYFWGNFFLKLLRVFFKPDHNSILFVSYGGKMFDDSPRAIYEYMINNPKTAEMKYYWAFIEPDKFDIPVGEKIRIDTLKYFIVALKSKIWVTNSEVGRGLKFKNMGIFCLNTWHGTPIKKIGRDAHYIDQNSGFGSKDASNADIVLAQGEFDANILARLFNIDRDKVRIIGLPRNDVLANSSSQIKSLMKSKLGIGNDKKVILYAPTYREFTRDKKLDSVIAPPVNFDLWRKMLSDKYVILFRAHYETAKILNINFDHYKEFVYNMSDYPILNDLMLASDLLVSDYSSIFFDYSILGRPMLCFAYDYDQYCNNRGLYIDLQTEFPGGVIKTESELLSRIITVDTGIPCYETIQFRSKYIKSYGKATELAVGLIIEELLKQEA